MHHHYHFHDCRRRRCRLVHHLQGWADSGVQRPRILENMKLARANKYTCFLELNKTVCMYEQHGD